MPYRAMPYGATPCHTLLAYEDPPPHGKSVCTYLWILNRLLQWSWVFSEFIFLMQKQRGTLASIEWSNLNLLPCLHVNNPIFFSLYCGLLFIHLYVCGVAIVTKSCTYFREYWIFCHLRQRSRISWERQYTGKILNLPLSCTFTAAVQKWIPRWWWWWWWWSWNKWRWFLRNMNEWEIGVTPLSKTDSVPRHPLLRPQ